MKARSCVGFRRLLVFLFCFSRPTWRVFSPPAAADLAVTVAFASDADLSDVMDAVCIE